MDRRCALRYPAAVLALVFAAWAADTAEDLLTAARIGDTARVRSLLQPAINLEVKGKDGKTPLIWAAQEGRTEVVGLLLAHGADPRARDNDGLSAYDLALVSSKGKHEAILALRPKPVRVRVDVDALWLPVNMTGSCFESRADLARRLQEIAPDALALAAFTDYARSAGKDALEIVRSDSEGLKAETAAEPPAGVRGAVILVVRPGVSCAQHADRLSLEIDVRVIPASGGAPAFHKTFGAGLTGHHEQVTLNPTQYRPIFEEWAKLHAGSIYWEALRVLLRQ